MLMAVSIHNIPWPMMTNMMKAYLGPSAVPGWFSGSPDTPTSSGFKAFGMQQMMKFKLMKLMRFKADVDKVEEHNGWQR